MTTSTSTYNFDVLFIDNFRERHRSRWHSGVLHFDPFRPFPKFSSCVVPLSFHYSVCVYWCRRGQILLVFMMSRSSALRSYNYRTSVKLYLQRKPMVDHWFHGLLGKLATPQWCDDVCHILLSFHWKVRWNETSSSLNRTTPVCPRFMVYPTTAFV